MKTTIHTDVRGGQATLYRELESGLTGRRYIDDLLIALSAFYWVMRPHEAETTESAYIMITNGFGRWLQIRLSGHAKPGYFRQVGCNISFSLGLTKSLTRIHKLMAAEAAGKWLVQEQN